jgi:glycosyltransferase involved in cell wall biosynthesis
LPCVILEAFSCGIPVISTNVGGIEEYFPDNFGKLIDIKDEEKLKEEILNFYNKKYNIATKEEMHNYVKSLFSEEAIAKAFTNLYHRALNI